MTGQHLIWTGCNADWCTHCLTLPNSFFNLNGTYVTVIDHHPQLLGNETYYTASQCKGNSNYDLFTVAVNAFLTFVNCTLADIRVLYDDFAGVSGSIAFIHTQILRMDFYYNFLWSQLATGTATVLLDHSYVTGWHRDHPILDLTYQYTPFFFLNGNVNLIIRNTTFEENYEFIGAFIEDNEFLYFSGWNIEIADSLIRNCIGTIDLKANSPNTTILLRNVTVDSHFNYLDKNFYIYGMNSTQAVLSDVHFLNCFGSLNILLIEGAFPTLVLTNFKFSNNRVSGTDGNGVVEIAGASGVALLNCVFTNNGAYTDSYAPYFFYNRLLSLGLVNPYPQIAAFYAKIEAVTCNDLIYVNQPLNVTLSNVTISGDLAVPCEQVCYIDNLQAAEGTVGSNLSAVYMAGGSGYGLNIGWAASSQVSITNCVFEDLEIAVYVDTAVLVVSNSTFQNLRVSLESARHPPLYIYDSNIYFLDCSFLNNSGAESGVLYMFLSDNTKAVVFSIINCLFDSNSVVLGGATDVSFLSVSQSAPATIEIRDCVFRNGIGVDPSYSVRMSAMNLGSALIKNCTFSSVHDMTMGLIMLQPEAGTFLLKDILFDSISAPGQSLISLESLSAYFVIEHLSVRNCLFSTCILAITTKVGLNSCDFESNEGTVLSNAKSDLEDHGSYFHGNTNDRSPCYSQSADSSSGFYGTRFESNRAAQIGVAEILGPSSFATFEDCMFGNNSATMFAGVMQVSNSPSVTLNRCTFLSNSANSSSVFLFEKALSPVSILNSVFAHNIGSGLLKAVYSAVVMQNVTFTDLDFTETDYQIMLVSGSKLTLENVTVASVDRLQGQGGFLSLMMSSTVGIRNSRVSGLQCIQNVITVMFSSSLSVVASYFYNMSSSSASLISTSVNSKLALQSVLFRNITVAQGVLYTQQTDVNVENSIFDLVNAAVVLHTESCSLVTIQNSYFGNVTAKEVGAVQSAECTQVTIQDCNFTSISALVTAGAQIAGGNVTVENCMFSHMVARTHGALEIEGDVLNVSHCSFMENSAGNTATSFGGALYINNQATTSVFISENVFTRNSATAGGAFYWNSNQSLPELESSNLFAGNTAVYGSNTAFSTFKLSLGNDSLPVLASGQVYTQVLVVKMVDQLGQVVATDSSSKALMVLKDGGSLAGTLVATALQGVFSFSGFIVTGNPGNNASVTIIPSIQNCLNTTLTFPLRSCVIGEIQVSSGACVRCSVGTYSLNLTGTACSRCFPDAVCTNGSSIFPNPGYWRPDELYDGLFQCQNKDACVNDPPNATGTCAEGYIGNMCQSCAEGSSRSGQDKCAGCPSKVVNAIRLTSIGIALFIFVHLLVRSALKSALGKSIHVGVYMKIFMNYLHMTILIANFGLNWPAALQQMFDIHAFLGSSGEQFMSLDCAFNQPYFKKLVIVAVLPMVLFLANLMYWVLYHVIGYGNDLIQKFICSLIVTLLYAHPIIVKVAFSAFHCVTIKSGELWLRDEMDIPCWDQTHSRYALGVALPALIVWGFGIPTFLSITLIRIRKQLSLMSVRRSLGFLCNGYRAPTFFWEMLIVYRKVSIILLYVFMSTESVVAQALALNILLWVTGSLQSRYQPFKVPELNKLEQRSLWVCIITVYSGIFFATNALSDPVQVAFMAAILLANAYFIALWTFSFSRLLLIQIVKKSPRIRRILSFFYHKENVIPQERSPTLPPLMMHLYLNRCYNQAEEQELT